MNVMLTPARLHGTVTPPPSKSQAHRVMIAAALSEDESNLTNIDPSQDILATRHCLEILKAPSLALPLLDCGESGSTLRFLIPLALALRGGGVFTGRGRLMLRPMQPYAVLCAEKGIYYAQENGFCTVRGVLKSGQFSVKGDISSQFITGLLYAVPLLEGDSELLLTTALESKGYVDMTLDVLKRFGIQVDYDGDRRFEIPGGQHFHGADVVVEADYSQAAFYYVANGIGNSVDIKNLTCSSAQGDRVITDYAARLCKPGEVILDVSQCPDLVPALALHAALREGQTTHIVNAGRLRMKESDRLDTVTTELNKLGARVEQTPNSLAIQGVAGFRGGVTVHSHNDHRIAMMLAIAATRADNPIMLLDAGSVAKSYPSFWADYVSLGGYCEEVTAQ